MYNNTNYMKIWFVFGFANPFLQINFVFKHIFLFSLCLFLLWPQAFIIIFANNMGIVEMLKSIFHTKYVHKYFLHKLSLVGAQIGNIWCIH